MWNTENWNHEYTSLADMGAIFDTYEIALQYTDSIKRWSGPEIALTEVTIVKCKCNDTVE